MGLLGQPHPSELATLLRPDGDIDQCRNLFCDRYDGCLDEAVSSGWVSWTCSGCVLFAVRGHVLGQAERFGGTVALRRRGRPAAAVAP